MERKCKWCGRTFEAKTAQMYCSPYCHKKATWEKENERAKNWYQDWVKNNYKPNHLQRLCKLCDTCKDYTYSRETIKGKYVKFKYCEGIKQIVEKHDWVDSTNEKHYITVNHYPHRSISYFIRHNERNRLMYFKGQHDLRLRFLREEYLGTGKRK